MEGKLKKLKHRFCEQGDQKALWEIVHELFPQMLVLTKPQNPPEALEPLKSTIRQVIKRPTLLCKSEVGVERQLLELMQKESLHSKYQKRTQELYSNTYHHEIEMESESIDSMPVLSIDSQIFLSSLDEMEQMIYEMRFQQQWVSKDGLRDMQVHLLGEFSLFNYRLRKKMQNLSLLQVDIPFDFRKIIMSTFFKNKVDAPTWEFFARSTKTNKKDKDNIHGVSKNLNKKSIGSEKDQMMMAKEGWNLLERVFYLFHKYHKIDSFIELWHEMNCWALSYPILRQELRTMKLLNREKIQEKHFKFRERRILDIYKIGQKEANRTREKMKQLQDSIIAKSNLEHKWLTY